MSPWGKRVARVVVAGGARCAGLLALAERAQRHQLTILCYHRVLPAALCGRYYDPALVVTRESFGKQCDLIAERFEALPLGEAFEWQASGRAKKPLLSITFDDGYRDNYQYALHKLEARALRATFFVIAGLVGTRTLPWYDAAALALEAAGEPDIIAAIGRAKLKTPEERRDWLAELTARAPSPDVSEDDLIMTENQLRSLAASGHEIGSHSVTHPILTQCSDEELAKELRESRDSLADIVGRPVTSFCYPNGDHDERVVEAVRRAGYRHATTMIAGLNDGESNRLTMRRWFVHGERLQGLDNRASRTLMRTEWSGLAQRLYGRGGG